MKTILILAGYLLVPLLVVLVLGSFGVARLWYAYLLTTVLIFFYPFILFRLDHHFDFALRGFNDWSLRLQFIMMNFFLGIPIAMAILFTFNKFLVSAVLKSNRAKL